MFDYPIPSTPYTLVISPYTMWDLLPLETLEMIYNHALTDLRAKIAAGHGGVTPPIFNSFQAPIQLVWRADIFWGGLNYSMLSIVFGALKQLHTDPAPQFRGVHRKMISYDLFEHRRAQRIERGEGQVESSRAISERRSISPLQAEHACPVAMTPYTLLIAANSGPVISISPLWELYTRIISTLRTQVDQGHGAAIPLNFELLEPPVELIWQRAHDNSSPNYTDLVLVFKTLAFHHTDLKSPWYGLTVRYHVIMQNDKQITTTVGGGWVGVMLGIGASNVSVQSSKRDSVIPVNTLPYLIYHLPNTPYILDIRALVPAIAPQLPIDTLLLVYDVALHRLATQIANGHGGDVPAAVNIQVGAISLEWRREHPPGLNYTMLLRVYSLLATLQTTEAALFPQGYRKSLFFGIKAISDEMIGLGRVLG